MEAIFGHHGTQDLSDGFGRFGLQTHGAVNGDQVQSRSTERARVNVSGDIKAHSEKVIFIGKKRHHGNLTQRPSLRPGRGKRKAFREE